MQFYLLIFLLISPILWAKTHSTETLLEINSERLELSKINLNYLNENKANIIGIEFILAKSSGDFFERNGLPLIRFIDNDLNPWNDILISFFPEKDNISHLKDHKSIMKIDNMSDYWPSYFKESKQNLERYIIPTNQQIRNELIANISPWFENEKKRGHFSIVFNNSSILLFKFLAEIEEFTRYKSTRFNIGRRPRYNDVIRVDPEVKPSYLSQYLKEYGIAPYPALKIENLDLDSSKVEGILSTNEAALQSGEGWPINTVDLLEYDLTDMEIKRILQVYKNIPTDIRRELERKHSFKIGSKLDEVLGVKIAPYEIYQLCDSSECAKQLKKIGISIWGPVIWDYELKLMNTELHNLKLLDQFARINGRMERSSAKAQIFIKHYQFLLD